MRQLKLLCYTISLLTLLCLHSCSKESTEDANLPYGKYPMVFSTFIEGMTATRSTSSNAWTGGEKIAIQINEEVKMYQAAKKGNLTATYAPFYWTNLEMYVTAWHTFEYIDTRPTTFSVQADQSGVGYQASDFVCASQKIIFNKGNKISFKHLPVKVVLNLQNGEGVTAEEVANAKVSILNQSLVSGTIAENWTVMQVTNGGATITPNTVSNSSSSSIQKKLEVLLVPQQMKDKQFVKITIGEGATERNYYYVPTGNDANLEAGNQYTYNIIVKKSKLEIYAKAFISWDSGGQKSTNGIKAEFHFHFEPFVLPENITSYEITDENNNVLMLENGICKASTNEINIAISANEGYRMKKFLINTVGLCRLKSNGYKAETRTYNYTFTDFRSDVWFETEAEVEHTTASLSELEVGNFYYSDGTYSSDIIKPGCIGIVFKVGAGDGDDVREYQGLSDIHGYVVALNDAHKNTGAWGIRGTNAYLSKENNKYNGYYNTIRVRSYNEYRSTNVAKPDIDRQYWAFKVASEYDITFPETTSGWYLPSVSQLNDIYYLPNRADLFKKAGGVDFKARGTGGYWSSTEYSRFDAWYYRFNVDGGGYALSPKSTNFSDNYAAHHPSYVRAVLTF